MSVFQAVKQISCNDTAQHLGLQGKRTSAGRGQWRCPFHDDRHPSMTCYDDSNRFYCFSCHAKGDAADLFARVLGLSMREAAAEACRVFGITAEEGRSPAPAGCDRPQGNARAPIRQRLVDKAAQAVRREYQQGLVILVQAQADAMVGAMEKSPGHEGWLWNRALQRACRVQEEAARLGTLTDEEVQEEIRASLMANRVPVWGEELPTPGRALFQEIAEDLERRDETFPRLNSFEKEAMFQDLCCVPRPREALPA